MDGTISDLLLHSASYFKDSAAALMAVRKVMRALRTSSARQGRKDFLKRSGPKELLLFGILTITITMVWRLNAPSCWGECPSDGSILHLKIVH